MKRYACHRLYTSNGFTNNKMIVCIDSDGKVVSCEEMNEEVPFTQWIGGIILLSPKSDLKITDNFIKLVKSLDTSLHNDNLAWHISHFDFSKEEIPQQSTLVRLM